MFSLAPTVAKRSSPRFISTMTRTPEFVPASWPERIRTL